MPSLLDPRELPKPADDQDWSLLRVLLKASENGELTEWQDDFVESIDRRMSAGGALTQKQKDKLLEVYNEYVDGDSAGRTFDDCDGIY